ncbi:MAG: hypothetical protein Q9217_006411 [Psora testacea]
MGRIATILFAHKFGTTLEPECKMYRLAADVFNDTAMVLDCLSPALPKMLRVILLSFSSVLRALCGVAAGSSKASLSAHFAKWGNLGELNAKDSSQETVISLLGMLAGTVVVSHISTAVATWSWLIILLSVHLAVNHAAVRSVSLHTLNRQRANLVFSNYLEDKQVLTPNDVSAQERIFEWDGVLRWKGRRATGKSRVGVSLQEFLKPLAGAHSVTGSLRDDHLLLPRLIEVYTDEGYLLWYDPPNRLASVVFKSDISPQGHLRAWAHALLAAHRLDSQGLATSASMEEVLGMLKEVQKQLSGIWPTCMERIKDAGWDINSANIESTFRMRIEPNASDKGEGGSLQV